MLGHAGGVLEEEMPRLAEMSDEESSECGSEGTLGEEGEEYEEEESGEEEEEIWSGGGGGGMGGGVEEAAAEPTSRASPRVAAQRMAHVPVELHDAELEGDAFEVRAERTCQVGVQIQGRLKACSHVWREIGASPWVLDVVDNGYKLPLIDDALPPPHAGGGNHAGSNTYGDWLERAVGELVTMGALKPSAVRPRVISPLDVIPKADYHETDNPDRLRMVLDTRWLNEYQQKIKFKYDDLNNSREMFSEGDGLFSIDFTSGYYHVDVHPEHQCLLGIEVNGKWYVFASLPFGVRDACRAFTLMVRAPVEFLRRTRGTRVLPYIDDLLFDLPCGWSAAQQEAERDFIVALFRRLGWLVGDKSELDITTEKKMIGWIVDTVAMTYSLPPKRVGKFTLVAQALADDVRAGRRVNAKAVARVTGHISAMSLALGRAARQGCRYLHDCVRDAAAAHDWNRTIRLSPAALREVDDWIVSIPLVPTTLIRRPQPAPADVILVTDASETACGSFVAAAPGPTPVKLLVSETSLTVHLTEDERARGSALRELIGVKHVIRANAHMLTGLIVEVQTDALAACYIYDNGGSQVRDAAGDIVLHAAVLAIDEEAAKAGIAELRLTWHPREEERQVLADELSKVVGNDDWWLSAALFAELQRQLGPLDVDCFASEHSAQLPAFHSRWWSPSAAEVDTFSVSWARQRVYLCPPPALVMRVIGKMRADGAYGVLVVPKWSGSRWWPLLRSDSEVRILQRWGLPHDPACFGSDSSDSVVSAGRFLAPLIALRFDCRSRAC